jgi:hypothetical protein
MDDARESRAVAVALMVLGTVVSLACASMIGALAVLMVMTTEKPAPAIVLERDVVTGGAGPRQTILRPLRAPREGECTAVIWNTGMIYCVRDRATQAPEGRRPGPAVVVQAQAEE